MKKIILLFSIFLFTSLNAQKRELGKVTIEELQEKRHPKDTSAVAAVLFAVGKTYFEYSSEDGFYMITDVSTKIKIYKKEGYKWANKSIAFYIGNNPQEAVSFNKVVTYNLVNGAIEKTKIKSEGEFIEKKNKFYSFKKIALPNVKEGSIVEYNYTIKSSYYTTFPDWDFQQSIPVNYSEYSTSIPEYFDYKIHPKGFFVPSVKKDILSKSLTLTSSSREAFQRTQRDIEQITYLENKTTFSLQDISAINEENFVNNIDNYTAGFKHELANTKFPNSVVKFYSQSWEDVAKNIYENPEFGKELEKNSYYDDDLKPLLANIKTNEEKISAIFNFVQNRMTWNEFSGYACNDGVRQAYTNKTGNTAEINLMLISMLRFAGLTANPVLVSTRSNGIPFYASRTAFNHVIAAVEDGQNVILMDATNKYTKPGILPDEDLNWFGKLIRNDKTFADINLMPTKNAARNITMLASLNESGAVQGKIRQQFTDNYALDYRKANAVLTLDAQAEKLEKRFSDIEIDNLIVQNKLEKALPITETFDFQRNIAAEKIGGKIYFSPLLFLSKTINPFKQEKREYPIDMGYPVRENITANITLPEGYKIETMPANYAIALHDGLGSFKFLAIDNQISIQISASIDINSAIYDAADYEDLQIFFAEIIKKETEKVVLVRI